MKELKIISTRISIYIKDWLIQENSLKYRSFYGETFSLLLLKQTSILDSQAYSILLEEYDKKDKNANDFHFEFNNYAFINFLKLSEDKEIRERLLPLRFKNTQCTNWTLLRSNTRILCKEDTKLGVKEAKAKIGRFQLKNGLILDDKGVKSFQYHCFSMAMIAEIYMETRDAFFLKAFQNGVSFIRKFILPDGDTLYIGRGQEQSFGYGALIYILALYYKFFLDDSVLFEIKLVSSFLDKYRLVDGNYPLVMNKFQTSEPKNVDLMDVSFSGWYSYNNYFDYLPFMGVFIHKAYDILKEYKNLKINYSLIQNNFQDNNFKKIVKKNYIAIISKPEGYWTNDLAIPLIFFKDKCITPIYGGDQYAPGLQNIKSLPLPFFEQIKKSIRWRSLSILIGGNILLVSPLGIMLRKFKYFEYEIFITTYVLSPFKVKQLFFYLPSMQNIVNFLCIQNSWPIKDVCVSPNGLIEGYYSKGYKQVLIIKLKK